MLCLRLLALLLTACVGVRAQTSDTCRERTAIVNALDARGAPIKNLASDSFMASHQGRLLNVSWLQHREDPSGRVAVLLDTSGSMKGNFEGGSAKWGIAHTAAVEFLSSAPSQSQVSFIAFSSGIGQRFVGLRDRRPIEDWLNRSTVREGKEVKGHTALYDAILEALNDFEPTQPGDAIYVITDGGENASAEKLTQLEHSLESSGVGLFAFLLDGPWPTSPGRSSVSDLYALVRESGGSLASVSPRSLGPGWSSLYSLYNYGKNTAASIRASTEVLQAEISSFYVLGVQFPDSAAKLEDWKVDVVDARGRRRRDVIVAYPHKLAPAMCSAQSAQR